MRHAFVPSRWPGELLDQLARQAKWKIKAAQPVARLRKPVCEMLQRVELLESTQAHPARCLFTNGQDYLLASVGTAGEVAAYEL